jgi:NAD(P)H-nitrite reductase large subunit
LPADSSRDGIVACRCEGLSVGEVAAAIAAGSHSQDAVKRRTRAGMGTCQGRYCGAVVNGLVAQALGRDPASLEWMTPRAPARPITLSDLVKPFGAFDRLDS